MTLKVTREKDRRAMLQIVKAILAQCPDARMLDTDYCGPRECGVQFEHEDGLHVTVEFDGDSRLDREGNFCLAWNTRGKAKISEAFGSSQRASVNPHHHGKCTAFANGFDDLCAMLVRAVHMFRSKTAYRAE